MKNSTDFSSLVIFKYKLFVVAGLMWSNCDWDKKAVIIGSW